MDANLFLLLCCAALSVTLAVLSYFFLRQRTLLKRNGERSPEENIPLTMGYRRDNGEAAGRFFEDAPSNDSYQRIKEKLFVLLETEKLYLSPDVRITELSRRISTSENVLSKAIKAKTGKNFCQLIHYFRVREAMRLFSLNPKLSTTDLKSMVGFKSQTTFNTAFSRTTGYTPAEWCREFIRKNGSESGRKSR